MASHYTAGTQVTLTANAATQPPASTFVRWHGDVPAGVRHKCRLLHVRKHRCGSCAYSEGAFSRCPGIRRVYFGPANTAFGSRMFEAVATQKEIFWNCDFPTSIGWGPLAGVNAGLVRFYAPLGNASWEEFMATGAGFSAMTAAETNAYLAAYPGDPLPVGMWKPRESARQYLLTWNPLAGQNTLTIDGVPQQIGAAEPARSTRLPPRRLSSSLRARRSAS